MDIKGAKILTERLAERQWLAAQSVQRGDQPQTDPDADYLESIGDDYRLYAFPEDGDSTPRRVKKVLVEGSWELQDGDDAEAHAAA
jgi:hypothetical protein